MSNASYFLTDSEEHISRPLDLKIQGLRAESLFIGNDPGGLALEVAVFSAAAKPTANAPLHQAFKARLGGRASPILIVVLHSEGASLCGVDDFPLSTYHASDVKQVERLCDYVLSLPDSNTARDHLNRMLHTLETALPGIENKGLLSSHELQYGTRRRPDWHEAKDKAQAVLGLSGVDLINALGFTAEKHDNSTHRLRVQGKSTALAVFLNDDEWPELGSRRFGKMSTVSYALDEADNENLDWVLMVKGSNLRLYNKNDIVAGGRKRTEIYVECQTTLLSAENSGLLWLLFSADALKEGGTIAEILEESMRFADTVAKKLRQRIYDEVVPTLAKGIAAARQLQNPDKAALALTYQMALTVLFRLLFIAYAEDWDLLPYKENESYQKRSLTTKAKELARFANKDALIGGRGHHWTETKELCDAIALGNDEWGVPKYNGVLFSSDGEISEEGEKLSRLFLPNAVFEPVLKGLLLTYIEKDKIHAPVDFRQLSVREFGTIYEGLLESELALADQDLTIDKKGTYLPAGGAGRVFVEEGQIYLHNRSGARKSSGSYYTPDCAVDHLLDGALEPALDEHLARIESLTQIEQAEQFFDFRIADIAMGSGHFLVAAIDRIEKRFSDWLEKNPIPIIDRELEKLHKSAEKALGELAGTVTIENSQLLRRMIAKRCIYGVDSNRLAVQLAQLSVWIDTFVPGLPLSLLDHNLVVGNSLVGIGSLDEVKSAFKKSNDMPMFPIDADNLLGKARESLERLAKLSDASIDDIEEGRRLMKEAEENTLPTKALFDIITAQPVAPKPSNGKREKNGVEKHYPLHHFELNEWEKIDEEEIGEHPAVKEAREILEPLKALHFPIAFPEVFLGRSQGFDVVLGNPPWEEVNVQEYNFWAHRFPGLRGLSQRVFEQTRIKLHHDRPDLVAEFQAMQETAHYFREILKSSSAFIMGGGNPDLYQAFAWRFWHIASRQIGKIGVVVPRSAVAAKKSESFRKELFAAAQSIEITTLENKNRWIFDIEARYTITLLCISKSHVDAQGISVKGPFNSPEKYEQAKDKEALRFTAEQVLRWSGDGAFPLLSSIDAVEVFEQLRKAPRLDYNEEGQWRARGDRELSSSSEKPLMDFRPNCPDGFWQVYKGESFNIWHPDTGKTYAWADPKRILQRLQAKRLRANNNSVHREFTKEYRDDESTLAPLRPRIAFRKIARATDSRTMISCLIPPQVFHTDAVHTVLFPRGDEKDQAFLLGVLCSIPLDWYARRFVELNFNFFLFNPLPIPRPDRANPLWQRVVELAGRLAAPDDRFADWAEAVGVQHGRLDKNDKDDKIHELDATTAHLYGLTQPQLTHIFETFHENWEYQQRLEAVLKHYDSWAKRIG